MRFLMIVMFLSIMSVMSAQTDSSYVSIEVEYVNFTLDFVSAKKKLFDFISKHHIPIQNQNESRMDLNIKFKMNMQEYVSCDSLILSLGYSSSKKLRTVSNYTRVSEINLELAYLQRKRESYLEVIKKMEGKSETFLTLWNEQKILEEKIFNKERELIDLNNKENIYIVSLDLNDEVTSPGNSKVSFVNMPGVEFSVLRVESPKRGISAKSYQGYFLKYLFTKGKSFATIGEYKSSKLDSNDTTAYTELFVIGFGQDFYSRHLGRGSRHFFNLYSGYTLGGIFATSKTTKSNIFYISPSIGLEIFKNKYFLIDTKVNYFVPFSDSQNLRGMSYNASFNVVF